MQGYPPGYDPSMDPTLSGMGGYQVGMDPMAGAQMAPAPGMGSLGSTPSGAMSNIQLSGGDQFALGAAQAAEMGTNAFFLTAMSSPILRASGHRGLAAVGRVTGAMDPFRMLGMGHRGVVAPAFNALSGGAASRGFGAGMRGLARGGVMRMGGRMALMGGAAASGYGIPIAAAMAVMEAPIMYAEQMGQGIKDQYTGMATMASAAPAGMHYTGADAKAFGFHGMPQMAKSMGMDMGGMQDLIGALGQQGTFNGARDMQQFSAKLRGALQQLKDVARETDSTLAEANQMIQGLNAHGFQGGQLRQAAMSVSGRGQLSGLGQDAIYASGTMGSDVGRQLGLNRQMMFNQFATGASTMAYGERTGRIDSNLVNFFGGAQQASAMIESQAAQGFMGSSLMAYAMDPRAAARGQSVVNQERLQQVLGGNVNASMLQTVTPEMVNASLQERARHVLMPHAQQAITQFGLAGGASDATASARMTAMGFTSSPEQALLMLQQRQAASFESTALEAQNSRRTALAQQAAIQDSLPGAITRAYRDSGLGELAHNFAQHGRNFGRNLAAGSIFGMQMPDLFTPNDVNTDRSVTAGGLESARRLTSAQLGMYEDYTSGNMAAFGGGRYSPGSMYSGGFLQGSSGLMTAEQLRTRGFTADFFEAGEDQLNARHA
ncbi:MAG: hypothetical protein VXZ72_00520, partial [Chlamydiota bacterium]|nr:hypothetical protein [Chlamydiota bacterium]